VLAQVTEEKPETINQKLNTIPQFPTNQQTVPFPFAPFQMPYQQQLPYAQLQPFMQQIPKTTETGPAAVFAIATGASAGFAWVRRKRKR
jgi:hypothetical protein